MSKWPRILQNAVCSPKEERERHPESGRRLAEEGRCTVDPSEVFKIGLLCIFRWHTAPGLARGPVEDFSLRNYDISSLWEVLRKTK